MHAIGSDKKLGGILVHSGKLSEKDHNRLQQLQHHSGKSFTHLLFEQKVLDEHEIIRALGEVLGLQTFRLESYQIDRDLLQLVPQKMAERYGVIPTSRIGSILTLATSEPLDLMAQDDLRRLTGCELRLVLSTPTEIQNALAADQGGSAAIHAVLREATPAQVEIISESEEETSALAQAEEAPVVRMLNFMISEAAEQRASDIHLEPYRDHFRIRYRVDGILKETLRQPLAVYPALIARIKILSNLDITEKRLPQDGRFKMQIGEQEIDFRVSILPTFFGEKGVLRLLDKKNVRSGLDELGFSEKPITLFKEAIQHPYGMILVTGPTGSGKSTTLYSVLNLLNTPGRNLMTIEDPIEYQIEGITQTQINPEIGLTFANGLRSLLRQSPDIVLVGEIRDGETADIAVKAALTGHLVLSTLHTNSASGAVTRLIDMEVEPFLIASSVILVAGQRLLRRICNHCRVPSMVSQDVLKRLAFSSTDLKGFTPFRGKGCSRCGGTGYMGRIGAIEVLRIDSEIREAILRRASSEEIERLGRKKGMETLFENARELFRTGKTALEEVLRVTETE